MISGDCPYEGCNGSIWLATPDVALPVWGKETCEECGRTFWEHYSRWNAYALTEDEFSQIYTVNEETKQITERPLDEWPDWAVQRWAEDRLYERGMVDCGPINDHELAILRRWSGIKGALAPDAIPAELYEAMANNAGSALTQQLLYGKDASA